MPGRPTTAVLAVAFQLLLAASAAAGTVSYQDGVLRYRDDPGQHVQVGPPNGYACESRWQARAGVGLSDRTREHRTRL